MKDHGWSWTLLGAALVSLESLDMIFLCLDCKNMANIANFLLINESEMPAWLGLSLKNLQLEISSSLKYMVMSVVLSIQKKLY